MLLLEVLYVSLFEWATFVNCVSSSSKKNLIVSFSQDSEEVLGLFLVDWPRCSCRVNVNTLLYAERRVLMRLQGEQPTSQVLKQMGISQVLIVYEMENSAV